MLEMSPSSKQWWAKARELLGDEAKVCNIPALKNENGEWIIDAKGKADLLAKTFHEKCTLAEREQNRFSQLRGATTLQWN